MTVTIHDVRWNHSIFQMASYLNIANFTLDPSTGRMSAQTSIRKRLIYRLWQFLNLCHVTYIIIRMVGVLIADDVPTNTWDFLPVSICDCVMYLVILKSAHFFLDENFEEFVKVYNEILRLQGKEFEKKKYGSRFNSHSHHISNFRTFSCF